MSGFTDYHAHFVYGVDDGARTREEMYAMLDAAVQDGVSCLYATSHSTPGMEPFPQEVYGRHLALARDYCRAKGYELTLKSGSELLYTPAAGDAAARRRLFTLDGTDWVLLEFVPDVTARELEEAVSAVAFAGYRILLAHIERFPALAKGGLLPRLRREYGVRCPEQRLFPAPETGTLAERRLGGRCFVGCSQLHVAPDPDESCVCPVVRLAGAGCGKTADRAVREFSGLKKNGSNPEYFVALCLSFMKTLQTKGRSDKITKECVMEDAGVYA